MLSSFNASEHMPHIINKIFILTLYNYRYTIAKYGQKMIQLILYLFSNIDFIYVVIFELFVLYKLVLQGISAHDRQYLQPGCGRSYMKDGLRHFWDYQQFPSFPLNEGMFPIIPSLGGHIPPSFPLQEDMFPHYNLTRRIFSPTILSLGGHVPPSFSLQEDMLPHHSLSRGTRYACFILQIILPIFYPHTPSY